MVHSWLVQFSKLCVKQIGIIVDLDIGPACDAIDAIASSPQIKEGPTCKKKKKNYIYNTFIYIF